MIAPAAAGAMVLILCVASGAGAQSLTDDEPVPEIVEPVNVNRATLADLMEIPGMDPDLARAILSMRLEAGRIDSVEALCRSPAITPARLLSVRPWLVAGPASGAPDAEASVVWRNSAAGGGTADAAIQVTRRRVSVAGRGRRSTTAGDPAGGAPVGTGGIAWRPSSRLSLSAGDQAPFDGLGLLVGLSNRPPSRGARASSSAGGSPWNLAPVARLARRPPAPAGRFLRGGSISLADALAAAVFEYHPGATLDAAGAAADRKPRGMLLRLGVRPAALGLVLLSGRLWSGVVFHGKLSGAAATLEAARDPAGRWRAAFAAGRAGSAALGATFSLAIGGQSFVNPLSFDSERAPAPGEAFAGGRNENRNGAALLVRARLSRRVAAESEFGAGLDRASTLRAWNRSAGFGRVRLEVSAGAGWSMTTETLLESRAAPGPSNEADPSLRRHRFRVQAGWERNGRRLVALWDGRLDLDVPRGTASTPRVAGAAEVLGVRGRVPLGGRLWVGGGVSRFRVPAGSMLSLYEERPAGISSAVTAHASGERVHAALEGQAAFVQCGVFVALEHRPGGPASRTGGFTLRTGSGR